MTFIRKIVKVRHPGTLCRFDWPTDLPDFGRYNLIYGWNGSGKTTISKLFRALGREGKLENCDDVVFSVNGRDIRGVDFEQEQFSVRVFNRDFVSDNVFPVFPLGGKDVRPIFVLGKDSIQKQHEIENFKEKLKDAQDSLETAQRNKEQDKKSLGKHCRDHALAIKKILRSSGDNPYNNYNKLNYQTCAEKMIGNGADNYRLSDNEHNALRRQSIQMPKNKIEEITYRIPALMAYAEAVSRSLNKTVVSATIQSLKSDTSLSRWIDQGLELHQSRDANRCLFCEQTLPINRLEQLEAHFNAEYKQFMGVLDAQIKELRSELDGINAINTVSLPNSAQFYEHLSAKYEDARNSLNKALKNTNDFLDLLKQKLEEKKEQVFERRTLDVHVPEIDSTVVECLNEVVRQHNTECDDFDTQVAQARKQLEAAYVADNLNEFDRLKNSIAKSQSDIEKASNEVSQFRKQIKQLEREITEHRKPAEELNEDLRKYLGHSELQLAVEDTGYTITRNNAPAEGLSEGEKTAIALLYFLKSLKDRHFVLAKGVVVFDDPVSSLDANALYLAFGFIQERMQNAAQVFILTHNFTLFRNVKNWFQHISGHRKKDVSQRPTRFYMLELKFDGNQRFSTLRQLDPLLEDYESEYHYLFARIYREAKKENRALKESYVLPNMARRLLESFLAFRKPQAREGLWQKLKVVEFDEVKKIRILRFLNTYSHADSVREHEHDPSPLAEASAVLKDLLELMEKEDTKHYQAMVELVEQSKVEA